MQYGKVEICGVNTSQLKLLKESEKRELLNIIKNGSPAEKKKARDKMINGNLRLVLSVIQRFTNRGENPDDLFQVGVIGLIKAISSFDPAKGARLATYSARCIENEILMHFRSQKKTLGDIYIDDPIDTDKDGNALTLMDIMGDGKDIVEQVDLSIRSGQLYGFLENTLDDREFEIIKHRYGLYGCNALTQREVAQKLNISRSYVSRIEKKALSSLRKMYEKNPY